MGFFKKVFGKKGILDKVTRGVDKATGGIASKVWKPALGVAAAIAAPATGGASLLAVAAVNKLSESKVGKIVKAVKDSGFVDIKKVAENIAQVDPKAAKSVEVVNSVAKALGDIAEQETGVKPNIQQTTAVQVDMNTGKVNIVNKSLMDTIKEYFEIAKNHVIKYKLYYLGGALLAAVFFFRKGLNIGGLFGKKWRV
jgi:ABC-type branched-subunit amino acid transport system permease subunit